MNSGPLAPVLASSSVVVAAAGVVAARLGAVTGADDVGAGAVTAGFDGAGVLGLPVGIGVADGEAGVVLGEGVGVADGEARVVLGEGVGVSLGPAVPSPVPLAVVRLVSASTALSTPAMVTVPVLV